MRKAMPVAGLVFLLICAGPPCAARAAENDATAVRLLDAAAMTVKNLGARCVFSGGEMTGTLERETHPEYGECSVWKVTGDTRKGNWSMLGVQFANPRPATPPIGFRLELDWSRPITINVEARVNLVPAKGFWRTTVVGRGPKRFPLEAGRQFIEKTWAELRVPAEKWADINGVTISLAEAVEARLLGFWLIYPEATANAAEAAGAGADAADNDEARRVNWFDADRNAINPVARPLDQLISVFALQAGGERKSSMPMGKHPESGRDALYWTVTGDPEAKGWAAYGFGLVDPVEPPPSGLRFEFFLTEPTSLGLQPVTDFNLRRTKGFYSAKNAGKGKSVSFEAGRHVLDLRWEDFKGIDPATARRVNGVKFLNMVPGGKMFIERVDLVFADAATAGQYRAVGQSRLAALQKVLVDGLAARGVDWRQALAPLDADAKEPLIWDGMMISAQREQIDYFTRLAESAGRPAPELPGLLARGEELKRLGAAGEFAGLRDKAEKIQTELDAVIDRLLQEIPPERRRFAYDTADRRFHYPDGRPFRMYGPHFFRSQFAPGWRQWRPWDLRYLSGLGFNGIRMQFRWSALEPERGTFDPGYLAMLKDILREAERYGFGVSVDLHWAYPAWFTKGKPGMEVSPKTSAHNSYHWPEALVDTWRRLGAEMAEHPNIVAFEVPTNETNIASSPGSLTDTPATMKRWNDWLKAQYGTREALDAVWSAAGAQYGLAEKENWDDASILPLGFQGDPDPQSAYRQNPRLYDHLRFSAYLQTMVSGDIVKALRESIPDAYGMFQRSMGDRFDRGPVPIDYHGVITCIGENVLPGTHYDMGSITARKAATLSLGSFDSEQQMEGNRRAVERHIALGLGFCPFAFHHRGGGGMLLADDDWHLKPEVGYLPIIAGRVRDFQPERPTGKKIAVITNSRLESTTGRVVGRVPDALAAQGYDVGVFDSLRLVAEPSLLNGYELAITTSNYLDLDLLDILRGFPGKTLLFGRLDLDAHAREPSAGLPKRLAEKGALINSAAVAPAGGLAGSIDLAGGWDFYAAPMGEAPNAPLAVEKYGSVVVPGYWKELEITGSLSYHIGDGWHRKTIEFPEGWEGRPLRLEIGGIDDIDWVFWNGVLIGHTGENTPNYWQAPRNYAIPAKLVRPNLPNELVICVRNIRGNGGIHKGPVVITGQTRGKIVLDGKEATAPCSPTTSLVPLAQLAPGAEALATFVTPDHPDAHVAVARQDRLFWYFKDTELNLEEAADRQVLDAVLSRLD